MAEVTPIREICEQYELTQAGLAKRRASLVIVVCLLIQTVTPKSYFNIFTMETPALLGRVPGLFLYCDTNSARFLLSIRNIQNKNTP